MWLSDATLYVEELDKLFFENIDLIKEGYEKMYPDLKFGGAYETKVVDNKSLRSRYTSAAMFSGGVDAFYTYLRHIDEKPLLISIWGADIRVPNVQGWENVNQQLDIVRKEFGQEITVIKSSFRDAIAMGKNLRKLVKNKYKWYHDIQHGIAIISHAAPLAYLYGFDTLYIASSYTQSQQGKYVCASDPTIDNHVAFGETRTIHDGYEANRLNKIQYICEYTRNHSEKIALRVCWESDKGRNCCCCEKCYRTIFAILSEGMDPNDFGFEWNDKSIKLAKKNFLYTNEIKLTEKSFKIWYTSIIENMKLNKKHIKKYYKYRWFIKMNEYNFENTLRKRISRKLRKTK